MKKLPAVIPICCAGYQKQLSSRASAHTGVAIPPDFQSLPLKSGIATPAFGRLAMTRKLGGILTAFGQLWVAVVFDGLRTDLE